MFDSDAQQSQLSFALSDPTQTDAVTSSPANDKKNRLAKKDTHRGKNLFQCDFQCGGTENARKSKVGHVFSNHYLYNIRNCYPHERCPRH